MTFHATDLARLSEADRAAFVDSLTPEEAEALLYHWPFYARPEQLLPPSRSPNDPREDWITWLILAGRGFGKTRVAAETVRQWIADGFNYVNIIGATVDDVRGIMVDGESGIMAVCPRDERPRHNASKRRLEWPNGAVSLLFSAEEPDRLRGKQHSKLACLSGDSLVTMADGARKPIADVREGEFVATRVGARRVIASALTRRNAEVFRVEISDGRVLVGTPDHPIFVEGNGFIAIADLKAGMAVCATRGSAATTAPSPTTLHIVSVSRLRERRDVFDIAVQGQPEFFANGVLVHNCDELAAWRYEDAWHQAKLGLRLGRRPQIVVSTTPRPIPMIRDLIADPRTHITRGRTSDNFANLPDVFIHAITRKYEGTRLGRQELDAEVLEDVAGALWTREMFDRDGFRIRKPPCDLLRVVVAVDPSGTKGKDENGLDRDGGDEIGIVVAGLGVDQHGYVLYDGTVKDTPENWARQAIRLFHRHHADHIIAEVNYGGDLVRAVIQSVDNKVPFKTVHATRGKVIRAEPVSTLYEQGRVFHIGSFAKLEDQLCGFTPAGYQLGGSPDRADALVWAITDLMLETPPSMLDVL